ncbi:MAG: ATP-binding cassette domain-containing protein [Deltaproteobacteria bacterium]|nr:ATP-binding cassette domain-containing protein [Deltaproteobacteria bacterium]MCB9788757.1 ATP-binding cassette domain-containing protein [Deltaproteobacteria bacterium]
MIEFIDIHKRFGSNVVLDGVSITVDTGQVLYIIGASGAGKSVLVKHLIGLLRPDSGRIILDGEDITWLDEEGFYPIRRKCAMVFQNSTLFDSMTLLENVMLPLRKHHKMGRKEAAKAARAKLELVNMDRDADQYPAAIGDGLRKRVAIARALTLDPQFVIFDEPTTGLDPMAAATVDDLIRSLRSDAGVTCVVVSHDLRSIFTVADRIAMIYKGKIRLDGTPEQFRNSDDGVIHQFVNGLPEGPMSV